MCWFADWVTLLSARCKCKMTLCRFSKNSEKSNDVKIRQVGAEFRADGQTDMMKLIVAFRDFVISPKTRRVNKNT